MAKLNEKISSIIKGLGAIPKTKEPGSSVSYAYRSIDDVMNTLNPLLSQHDVNMISEVKEFKTTERAWEEVYGQNKKQKRAVTAYVHLRLGFTDGTDTQWCEEVAMSEDYSDKAVTQAMSMAFKYALIRKLCITTKDMLDGDGRNPDEPQPKQKQPEINTQLQPIPEQEKKNAKDILVLKAIQELAFCKTAAELTALKKRLTAEVISDKRFNAAAKERFTKITAVK